MILRKPTNEDIEQLIKLHKLSFNDGDFYIRFFIKERFSCSECFIHRGIEGNIIGVLYARPITLKIGSNNIDLPFVTGVATDPSFRNKGIASELLDEACNYFSRKHVPFVILYPFNHDFYRKQLFQTINYFYSPYSENLKDTTGFNANNFLSKLPVLGPKNITFNELSTDDYSICNTIYCSSVNNLISYHIRDEKYFKLILTEHLEDGGSGILFKYFGNPIGYVLFSREGIKEIVFTKIFLNDLSTIFAEIVPYFETPITYRKALDDGSKKIIYSLARPSDSEYCMARLCDIEAALKVALYDLAAPKNIYFQIQDSCFSVITNKGRASSVLLIENFTPFQLPDNFSSEDTRIIETTPLDLIAALLGNAKFNPLYKNIFCVYNIVIYDKY